MGNAQVQDLSPVRADERKELNLSRKMTYKQYCKHIKGEFDKDCLAELPWSIRDSISLYERMNASFNRLSELPPELPLRLPHLNYLDLSHNQLTALPESFGLLFHIQTLLLCNNKIKSLPDSFVHLVKLEKADLSSNLLESLPADIGKMEALSKLNVSHNKLKVLPVSLGGCRTLTVLLACDNRLHDPPQSVANTGSDTVIEHLKKSYRLGGYAVELTPASLLNVFPRVRGNQLQTSVPNPHSAQVQYIQSQTHTMNTASRIKTPLLPPPGATLLEADELTDRILGLLYGAAIGDAICLATRCMNPDECSFYYSKDKIKYSDIRQDQCRIRWQQGDWTSNFDMMVLVLDCILAWAGVLDELDFAKRLQSWVLKGFPELGDTEGIILSETIQKVCHEENFLVNPHAAAKMILDQGLITVLQNGQVHHEDDRSSVSSEISTSSLSSTESVNTYPYTESKKHGQDNGALVHIAILGVPYFHSQHEVEENTVRICKTTHADPICIASCVAMTSLVSMMLQGKYDLNSNKSVEDMISKAVGLGKSHIGDDQDIKAFSSHCAITEFSSLNLTEAGNIGHVYKALGAGLVALRSQCSFRGVLMKLVMAAGDSNSNGCVAGALLGCKVGFSRLPQDWVSGLKRKQTAWLNTKINLLLDMMGLP
ncbi:hypothetical protein ACJMK2_015835 [Sinanodonta woodiana]|uniref:Uncharacterized protein n=1 Tax=Sinanodonta woodiana TaxID=1069815 RepID=A0ABD3UVB5_SINWO